MVLFRDWKHITSLFSLCGDLLLLFPSLLLVDFEVVGDVLNVHFESLGDGESQ